MIVAALLLQNPQAILSFEQLFVQVQQLYSYLLQRGGVKMIMREPPSRLSVLDTVRKLGFEITEVTNKQRKGRKKAYNINMDAKRD